MMALKNFLVGKKTYLVLVSVALTNLIEWAEGSESLIQSLRDMWPYLAGATFLARLTGWIKAWLEIE